MNLKYRRKLKFLLTPLLIVSLVFILYQLIIFSHLPAPNSIKLENKVLGTHMYQASFYVPKNDNKFQCIVSQELVDFTKINDDYCDCEDGSDEPGTSACPNGSFFCSSQASLPGFKNLISSSRVNDGICDCCDGSDEYTHSKLPFRLNEITQIKIRKFMSPCPNLCLD